MTKTDDNGLRDSLAIKYDDQIPWSVIYKQAAMFGAMEFSKALQTILNTPEPQPADPPKQETWRDRPPLL